MDINKYIPKHKIEANHLLSLYNLSAEDIFEILYLTKKIKLKAKAKEKITPLADKAVAFMISSKNSRYRVPFELSVKKFGGIAFHLSPDDSNLADGLSYTEMAELFKSYGVNAIVTKVKDENVIKQLYKESSLPIINCLNSLDNPCQVLADIFTVWEKKNRLSGLKLGIINGDKQLNSATLGAYTKVGVSVSVVCPENFKISEEQIEQASQFEDVLITSELKTALLNADIVTTHFSKYDRLTDEEKKLLEKYKLTLSVLAYAKPDVTYMHDLPVNHNAEVSDEVFYSERSTVYQQAENLIYVQQAVLLLLLNKQKNK